MNWKRNFLRRIQQRRRSHSIVRCCYLRWRLSAGEMADLLKLLDLVECHFDRDLRQLSCGLILLS